MRRSFPCYFCTQEFKTEDNPENFAATPPLEALRVVVSRAAMHGNESFGVMINDVARAYFNAKIDRLLYCELPEEDTETGKDLVGRLELLDRLPRALALGAAATALDGTRRPDELRR